MISPKISRRIQSDSSVFLQIFFPKTILRPFSKFLSRYSSRNSSRLSFRIETSHEISTECFSRDNKTSRGLLLLELLQTFSLEFLKKYFKESLRKSSRKAQSLLRFPLKILPGMPSDSRNFA